MTSFTLWFTGLPCAGKSTLATHVAAELTLRRHDLELLDGDVLRDHWPTGFTPAARDLQVRRIAFGCWLLNKRGISAIVAAVSPYHLTRAEARAVIPTFLEVYVRASVKTCIARDVKGHYARALAGELPHFTGISAPYEPPRAPDLIVDTERGDVATCTTAVLALLDQRGLVEGTNYLGQCSNNVRVQTNQTNPNKPNKPNNEGACGKCGKVGFFVRTQAVTLWTRLCTRFGGLAKDRPR